MSKVRSSVVALVVGVLATLHVYSEPDQLLNELRVKLAMIRASSADEPVGLSPVPAVDALRGASRDTVRSALGAPDNCGYNENECASQSSWAYWFFHLPAGWRGGGPELWLTFDARGLVQEAKWQFSR
jgi:hypothetical protein